jgi:hypothetical protein
LIIFFFSMFVVTVREQNAPSAVLSACADSDPGRP